MSALTSRDVARLAGVSQSTVSYVMSGKRPISENTRGKVLALAGRKLCDAIVLMDIRRIDERVAVGAELRVPIVLIGVPKDTAGLHCVDVDFHMAARLAVDELAATGHDRILLIGHPAEAISQDLNFVRRFADAAEEAADRHGIAFEQVAPVEWGRAGARDAVERVLARWIPGERLGLLVPNSQSVQPVLHALAARGVVPGRDVSVIAVLPDETEPPVTNVSLEPRDVSRRAMETLFWLLDPTDREEPRP
jgi:DNA-binding LacI/PurR family transcriptional regulator